MEVDMGTENVSKFKEHIGARIEFIQSGKYEEVGVPAVRIAYLIVDSPPARRRALWNWTREVLKEMDLEDWGPIFWFARLDWFEIYYIVWLYDRRWLIASILGRDSLFDYQPYLD
jgi:hypothetical protein